MEAIATSKMSEKAIDVNTFGLRKFFVLMLLLEKGRKLHEISLTNMAVVVVVAAVDGVIEVASALLSSTLSIQLSLKYKNTHAYTLARTNTVCMHI